MFRMIVRIYHEEALCTHETSTVILIMVKWCNAMLRVLLTCISSYLKLVLRYRCLILGTQILTLSVYVSKDVRIRDYFSEPKGISEQIVRESLV
jgi:hypothetical protein